MNCPRCGNMVNTSPVDGIWTCEAQYVSGRTPVGSAVGPSADSVTYERCGHQFRFSDLVAQKERFEATARHHASVEQDQYAEKLRFEQQAHDRAVAENEEAFGSREQLRAKIQEKDERKGRLGAFEPRYRSPLAFVLYLISVICGVLWWSQSRGTVPSWIPEPVTDLEPSVFVAVGALAFAAAAILFVIHLRFAAKARWLVLAFLGVVVAGLAGYVLATRRFDQVPAPEWIPGFVDDLQLELLVAGFLAAVILPSTWLISRVRWLQATASQEKWAERRKELLEQVGCGDRSCDTCMGGLERRLW